MQDLNVLPALLRHDGVAIRQNACSCSPISSSTPKDVPAFQSEPFRLAKAEDIVRGLPPQNVQARTVQAKPEVPAVQKSAKDKRSAYSLTLTLGLPFVHPSW